MTKEINKKKIDLSTLTPLKRSQILYYQKNRKRIIAYANAYYAAHKEDVLAKAKIRYAKKKKAALKAAKQAKKK